MFIAKIDRDIDHQVPHLFRAGCRSWEWTRVPGKVTGVPLKCRQSTGTSVSVCVCVFERKLCVPPCEFVLRVVHTSLCVSAGCACVFV